MDHRKGNKYMSPYLAGFFIGLTLLASFLLVGNGLGATGSITRTIVAVEKAISPSHVDNNGYLAQYGGGETNPFADPLVYQMIGLLLGAFISGLLAKRVKFETNKGPLITDKQRWIFAAIGGVFFGFGARLARGCASGLCLTGGATLSVGAWIAIGMMFFVAYVTAFFIRKTWINVK
jgi:uncharacterized protein